MKITTLLSLVLFCATHLHAQTFEWASAITCPANNTNMHYILPDANGNVFVTGNFEATTDFDPGPGVMNLTSAAEEDIYISKLDAMGNLLWVRNYGSPASGLERGVSMVTDASGSIYVCGLYAGTIDFDPPGAPTTYCSGSRDGFLLKLDADGNFSWVRRMGSDGSDQANALTLDPSGNICMTGKFTNTATFETGSGTTTLETSGSTDTFICKYDTNGNLLWVKNYGSDNPWSVAIDNSGNIYTTGYFSTTADFDPGDGTFNLTSAGSYDIFISKLDGDGNFIWAKQMGGTVQDEGSGIAVDADGNVVVTGFFMGTADLDPGDAINTSNESNGARDVFICKLDGDGNLIWANQYGSTAPDEGRGIATDMYGNISASGFFANTVDFDAGADEFNLTGDVRDVYIMKLDGDGQLMWVTTIGGAGAVSNRSVYTNPAGDIVFVSVEFFDTVDVDPGVGEFVIPNTQGACVVKLNSNGNSVGEHMSIVQSMPYPNPTNGHLIFELTNMQNNVMAIVRNQLGQEVALEPLGTISRAEVFIPGAGGVYSVELLLGGVASESFRVVKE